MKTSPFLPVIVALFFAATAFADKVPTGKGSYRTDLPPNADGSSRRFVEASPLVSEKLTGIPIPTSDWWSSLVWPMHSPHSLAMFPHPIAVQAHGDGLGIGYTTQTQISDHLHEGKVFQMGTNYKFPYRESLRVGLKEIETDATVLDGFSDWAVTGLWKKGDDELRATFAHGSPFVYFEKRSAQPFHIQFTAAKLDANRDPVAPYVMEWKGITAKHNQSAAGIELSINAGKNIGVGSKARLVYDFDGDGKTDRTETFQLFATDPVEGSWETYSSEKQALDLGLTRGDMQDFTNGTIRFEFWKVFGEGSVDLKLAESKVTLPDGTERNVGEKEIATVGGGDAKNGAAKVFYANGSVLGVTLNGSHFGIFAPTGTDWGIKAGDQTDSLTSDIAEKNYLSVAALPDDGVKTLEGFAKFAYAFLRDTKISYRYDSESGTVATTYTATTEAMEGTNTNTIIALYRHQHLHVVEADRNRFVKLSYVSPRGEMKVLTGTSFTTAIPYLGALPALPVAPADVSVLEKQLEADTAGIAFEKDDTYWNGKEFGKFSELIQIADQLGKTEIRDRLLELMKTRIADWFDGDDKYFFYFDKRWGTVTGYPDSYGSGEQLNDHHFHYSYFIKAAATIAQFDPEWVSDDQYGAMIDVLIRDCANYDRSDTRFPWMRNLDPYAGHSWAAGHAGFGSGNNQESSSESMNFATSLILYGQATGRDEIRDLGIYWHSTEAETIRHYWFDEDLAVFPDGYGHSCVGMVWGDGGSYGTWWTANPEEIHGINYLPITAGSLYLGRSPDYVLRNLKNLESSNRNFHNGGFEGDPEKFDKWQDILFEYLALADPAAAIERYEGLGSNPQSELGETVTHTRQWLGALQMLGNFKSDVQANHPTAVAFEKGYVVFNPDEEPVSVKFTDGKEIEAEPGISVTGP